MLNFRLSGRLWHHRDFLRLWFSDTVSQLGAQFTLLAFPVLAVRLLGAGTFEIGLLNALFILPFPTLGLFVGVWADRFQKRLIMVICNLGRMLTLGSIPLSYFFGTLGLYQVYIVTLVNGIFTVFFDISYQSYLPILIDRSDLVEGNSKLQVSASGAQVAGPTLAGFVYQLVGGPLAIAADSLGYLTSALSLSSIKKHELKPKQALASKSDFFGEMKEGVRVVFGNQVLRRIASCTATYNLGSSISGAVMIIFLLNSLQFTPVVLGFVGTVGSIGFLLGVFLTPKITQKLGLGMTLALSAAMGFVVMANPLALYTSPFILVATISVVASLGTPLYNINQVSLRQAITPDHLQGRMNATVRTLVWGTIPVGAITGGILGGIIGVVNTIYVGGAVSGFSAAWIIFGPVVKLRKQPQQVGS